MYPEKYVDPEAKRYFRMAYNLQMKGDYQGAEKYYKTSIQIQPTAIAHTFLGWTFSFLDKYSEAIIECQKAIQLDPDFGNPYNDIGSYLIKLEKYKEAIPWLEKAKSAPDYDQREFPYINLGRIYEAFGLWPLAIEEYKKAIQINDNYHPAKVALSKARCNLN